jgi:AcrR family transcriptional regulator
MSQARAAKPPERAGDDIAAPAPESGRRAQTRQALMDAAETLFAERGYHETSVPDIVRTAGVSQGTFYQYFGHRRDVLMALARIAHDAAAERPAPRGGDFSMQVRADVSWYLSETVRYTNLAKIWHDAAAYDREIADMTRQAREARAAELATRIRRIETAKGLDPEVAGSAMVAMIEEFAYRWFVEGGRGEDEVATAADTLGALITRSLGLEPAD